MIIVLSPAKTLDFAGKKDSSRATFKLGEWKDHERVLNRGGTMPGAVKFDTTDELPWHDPRVPNSGVRAEALRAANATKKAGFAALQEEVNNPRPSGQPLVGRRKK